MRALPPIEVAFAIAALVLVVAASAWWANANQVIVPVTPPHYDGPPVQVLRASVPEIGDFQRDYNVNKADPFVPFEQREMEKEHIESNIRNSGRHRITPTPVAPAPAVAQALVFPTGNLKPPPSPVCVGLIAIDGGTAVLLHFGDNGSMLEVHPGDRLPPGADAKDQWTLVGVLNDSQAQFLDPAGHTVVLPIGGPPGEPPVATTTPAAPTHPNRPGPPQGMQVWKPPPGVVMPPGIQPRNPQRRHPRLKQPTPPQVVPQQ